MEFVVIFAKENPSLFAHKKVGAKTDVLTTLFANWNNPTYLWSYFEKHSKHLASWSDGSERIESAADKTFMEATELHLKIIRLASNYQNNPNGVKLGSMFRNLHDKDDDFVELRESKAYGLKDQNWLRVYAIRVDEDCYLVTGGMIKLTGPMKDMGKIGTNELKNLKTVKEFLIKNEITSKQSLIEYINGKGKK